MSDDLPRPGKLDREPPRLHSAVQRLLHLLASEPRRRLVIGLVGLPGSGKSTLAQQLTQAVNLQAGPGSMLSLGMDGFHLTRAALARFPDPAAALARRGAPWTFDPQALATALQAARDLPLARGPQEVCWPGFEHGVGDPVPDAVAVASSVRLVMVEGLYLLHRADGWNLGGLLDECWFLDVDTNTALERLTARHMAAWGLTSAQAEARVAANDRHNLEIVLQGRHRADWLVTG